jgi:hypothetical protein
VEYVNCIFIYDIVQYFDDISSSVIANNQPLVFLAGHKFFIERVPQGITIVKLGNSMFESGIIELYIRKHR